MPLPGVTSAAPVPWLRPCVWRLRMPWGVACLGTVGGLVLGIVLLAVGFGLSLSKFVLDIGSFDKQKALYNDFRDKVVEHVARADRRRRRLLQQGPRTVRTLQDHPGLLQQGQRNLSDSGKGLSLVEQRFPVADHPDPVRAAVPADRGADAHGASGGHLRPRHGRAEAGRGRPQGHGLADSLLPGVAHHHQLRDGPVPRPALPAAAPEPAVDVGHADGRALVRPLHRPDHRRLPAGAGRLHQLRPVGGGRRAGRFTSSS